ncbi:MAG: trigger factor [Endomicrobium sp.]|jgi:trigger factor|nr:trigger factor [Endomicrobium sp.]
MVQETNTVDFKSTVVDRKPCSITIDVEVAENVASCEIENTFNQMQKYAKVDGFRRGKVPMSIVKQQFSSQSKGKAVENIVRKTVLNALDKEGFTPIDFPVVDEFDYELGQILKYRFSAQCHPKVEVKDYKGIPIKKEVFKITDANLNQSLDALRERNARLVESKSLEIKKDSFVSVDYEAFDNEGIPLPEITSKGHMLDLSSENTLKGFKYVLVGAKIGEEKDTKIEYPADYPNKQLAGKTISFKVKIIEIKEKQLPELNDDFAKDMGTENLEDLKSKVKETMEMEEKRRQDMEVKKQIMGYLLEKNKFEVPSSLVAEQKTVLIEKMKSYMQNQGAPRDYIANQIALGDLKFAQEAENNVRLSYILNSICNVENLVVTDTDIDVEKNKMKASNPGRDTDVDKYFSEKRENITVSLKEQKLFSFLVDNAKVETEEKKGMPLSKN